MPAPRLAGAVVPLTAPAPGTSVFEPHVAIDCANPERIAAAAGFPNDGIGICRGIWSWSSRDGGQTWSGNRIEQAKFDGEAAADPVVAFTDEGALVQVAMNLPGVVFEIMSGESYTRLTSPTWEERLASLEGEYPTDDMIGVARSDDDGASWASTTIPGSGVADKTTVAVDRNEASPYRGNVYAAWTDMIGTRLAFARSMDGARSMEPAIRIAGQCGFPQLAVGADGVVHLMWAATFAPPTAAQHPQAGSAVFHARSIDGGATFEDPRVVAEHGGVEKIGLVALAAAPSGALLATWSEGLEAAAGRGEQSRHTIRWIHSPDGERWSEPVWLVEPAPQLAQGLPAVAATAGGWHILSYDAGADSTTVRIYSADQAELAFAPSAELATRGFGFRDIYLHGSYQLRSAKDIVIVGDYAGLAGAGSRLVAAFVLPDDGPGSKQTAHVGVFDEA
jgi:hypothetical protein